MTEITPFEHIFEMTVRLEDGTVGTSYVPVKKGQIANVYIYEGKEKIYVEGKVVEVLVED